MKIILLIAFIFMSHFNVYAAEPSRFITEHGYKEKRARQIVRSPRTLTQLRNYGVTEEMELKLEYFFYTNAESKAARLANALKKRGYSVERKVSVSDKKLQVVTGWTGKMLMSEAIVVQWTMDMMDLGYSYDCEFDGWGTTPAQ